MCKIIYFCDPCLKEETDVITETVIVVVIAVVAVEEVVMTTGTTGTEETGVSLRNITNGHRIFTY